MPPSARRLGTVRHRCLLNNALRPRADERRGSAACKRSEQPRIPRRTVGIEGASWAALQSGRPDLNRRPHAPQACALPGCATPRVFARRRTRGRVPRALWTRNERARQDSDPRAMHASATASKCQNARARQFCPHLAGFECQLCIVAGCCVMRTVARSLASARARHLDTLLACRLLSPTLSRRWDEHTGSKETRHDREPGRRASIARHDDRIRTASPSRPRQPERSPRAGRDPAAAVLRRPARRQRLLARKGADARDPGRRDSLLPGILPDDARAAPHALASEPNVGSGRGIGTGPSPSTTSARRSGSIPTACEMRCCA